jgi:uncharacterized protein (TIGR03437 family)
MQTVQANQWGMFDTALWNNDLAPIVYLAEPNGAVKAFPMLGGTLSSTSASQFPISNSFFVGLAVSADGGKIGTGLVWLTTGDTTTSEIPGTLHVLDAGNLSNELWNSDMNANRDGLGRFAKFVAPTVANGRVYVPTFSNAVVIYGLLSGQPAAPAPQITAVTNGASFIGGAVAPGEIVAIFGANLGVSQVTQFQPGANGNVGTILAGTQVLINGVPAPVLYVSSTQVGAVTPFGLSGATANFQVVYNGQTSAAVIMPVAAAAPGMFSQDGNGGGEGVINPDGNASYFGDLSAPGSVVSFYATGAGQTNPPSVDGSIMNATPYPTPALPVTVLINGQSAQVVYAGAAPGMVAGVLQVDVVVPDTASGYDLQVLLQVGDFISPNFLWISTP